MYMDYVFSCEDPLYVVFPGLGFATVFYRITLENVAIPWNGFFPTIPLFFLLSLLLRSWNSIFFFFFYLHQNPGFQTSFWNGTLLMRMQSLVCSLIICERTNKAPLTVSCTRKRICDILISHMMSQVDSTMTEIKSFCKSLKFCQYFK